MPYKKQRDASQTKDRILSAAAIKFSEKGYDNASTREIGQLANANITLINRYFGSKKGLFREAVIPALTIAPLLQGAPEGNSERIARHMGEKTEQSPENFDPTLAILRSMGSETVGPLIREAIKENVVKELAKHIRTEDADVRAALVTALLFGVDAIIRVMDMDLVEQKDNLQLTKLIKETLDRLMTPGQE